MTMRIKALSAFQLPDGSMSVPGTIYSNIAEAFGAARVGEKRAEDLDGVLQPPAALRVEQRVSDGGLYNEQGQSVAGGGGGATAITVAALFAAKRAGTLVSGRTYQTPNGYQYYANSTSNFWPLGDAKVLSGTSMSLGGDSFNANSVVNSNRQSVLSIPSWAATLLPEPLEIVAWRAVAGTSWSALASAQLSGLLADASDIVHINCGANVWLPVAASTTVDQAMTDAKPCLDALSASKQLVIVDNSAPGVFAQHARMYDLYAYNERLKALCAQYPNVVYVDIWSAMVDASSATGDVLLAKTYDNLLHPNMRGAMCCGKAVASALAARVIFVGRTATPVAGSPDFSTTGGTKTAGSGSITGNMPTGMRAWISSGAAAVALTNINTLGSAGYQLGVSITNAAGTLTRTDIDLGGTSSAFNAGLQAGDVIRGWIGVRFKSFANLDAFYATMTVTGGGGVTTFGFSPHTSADTAPNVETPFVAKIFMPPQTLGAGFTSLNLAVAAQLKANAAAAAAFDVWGYGVEKLSTLP